MRQKARNKLAFCGGVWYNRVMEKYIVDTEENLRLISGEYREKFEAFRAYLLEFNAKYNLTAITEEKDVTYKHFLDSAAARGLFFTGASVAEIGSGAGFPSVPLKILREDLRFTLFESVGKKCDFLSFIVDKLGFSGMYICNMRSEDAARDKKYRENFDFAVARAVARMNVLCEYSMPLVKKGGTFIAYKSAETAEIDEAKRAIKELGGAAAEIFPYELPEGYGSRNLAVVEKIGHTPAKYPRGNGKERKQPL